MKSQHKPLPPRVASITLDRDTGHSQYYPVSSLTGEGRSNLPKTVEVHGIIAARIGGSLRGRGSKFWSKFWSKFHVNIHVALSHHVAL
jgi:hypothetical protein